MTRAKIGSARKRLVTTLSILSETVSCPLFLEIAAVENGGDVIIPLVGDNALGVVIQLLLRVTNVALHVAERFFGQRELFQHLFVALKNLDRVPALLLLGQVVNDRLLDVRQRVLHRSAEAVTGHGLFSVRGAYRHLRRLVDPRHFKGGNLHHPASQRARQLLNADLVAVLLDNVHHVDGNHHGNAQLRELGGEVKVPLQICAVNYIEDRVRALLNQVVSCDNLLQRIGRKRIDAGKVCHNNIAVLFQLALFFLHGDTRPVAHELIRAREHVKQRGFTAVRIAREGDFDTHVCFLSIPLKTKAVTLLRSSPRPPCAAKAHIP